MPRTCVSSWSLEPMRKTTVCSRSWCSTANDGLHRSIDHETCEVRRESCHISRTDEQQLYDPCTSIQVGAWVLAQNMRRMGNSWEAVSACNSSKPDLRLKHALKVYRNIPPAVLAGTADQ
ncbi:lytic transglycosylase domain-containing protein [Noviherbaspirillum cavernae]